MRDGTAQKIKTQTDNKQNRSQGNNKQIHSLKGALIMGQRSQIYVRITDDAGNMTFIARYFQWNYAERMISRARYTIEWLQQYSDYFTNKDYSFCRKRETERLISVINTNFDYKDVTLSTDLLKEAEKAEECGADFNDWLFDADNNDGILFIDVTAEGKIKYCLLQAYSNTNNIMDAEAYIKWETEGWADEDKNDPEILALNSQNFDYIKENAQLMTKAEIEEFLSCDYSPKPKF